MSTGTSHGMPDVRRLREGLPRTAFAFRGYNVTNLGRSHELLAHAHYGPIVRPWLVRGSEVASSTLGRKVDLVSRVQNRQETSLETYGEAVAMVTSMELAHVEILQKLFDIRIEKSQFAFGFSLGEIVALCACGVLQMEDALKIPLTLAADCVELAQDVSLAVLFTRSRVLPRDEIEKLLVELNQEGRGVIGISCVLAPSAYLLIGQGDWMERFRHRAKDVIKEKFALRRNEGVWPPIHTSITWQRSIPNRAALLMQSLPSSGSAPKPKLLSLVTGTDSYTDHNFRSVLHQWVDHPQLLWDVIYETLSAGVETIVNVGPEPNLIPASYDRIRENVESQTKGSVGMRALAAVIERPWLRSLLPERAALLRAPYVKQIVLEDWLLDPTVSGQLTLRRSA